MGMGGREGSKEKVFEKFCVFFSAKKKRKKKTHPFLFSLPPLFLSSSPTVVRVEPVVQYPRCQRVPLHPLPPVD